MEYYNIYLLAIIAATFLISYKGFEDISFFRKYEFHVGSIRAGEQLRMLSSGFLHADWIHLLLNMYVLYSFAPWVIESLGNFAFVLIYFGSLLFGSLLTMSLHKNDYNYRAIGASGAVTGVVYSSILLFPDNTIYMFFALPMPSYVFGILYLLYSIYGMKSKNDNIGHTAHFGGAIGGFLITLAREPHLFKEETFTVVALAVPIIILYIMAKQGKI